MSSPFIVRELTLQSFMVRKDTEVHEAIEHEGIIYKLEAAFELRRHRECVQLAQKLARESRVVLTTGMIENRVWTEIK